MSAVALDAFLIAAKVAGTVAGRVAGERDAMLGARRPGQVRGSGLAMIQAHRFSSWPEARRECLTSPVRCPANSVGCGLRSSSKRYVERAPEVKDPPPYPLLPAVASGLG